MARKAGFAENRRESFTCVQGVELFHTVPKTISSRIGVYTRKFVNLQQFLLQVSNFSNTLLEHPLKFWVLIQTSSDHETTQPLENSTELHQIQLNFLHQATYFPDQPIRQYLFCTQPQNHKFWFQAIFTSVTHKVLNKTPFLGKNTQNIYAEE